MPQQAVSHVENRGDAIVVTDETAAGGKHSVKIIDAPGLGNLYDPHLTYENLGHASGRGHNSFDLRIAKDSRIHFEWRDYNEPPYATGPHFTIDNGQLHVGKDTTLALPADTWIHFEVECSLGSAVADGWTLRVCLPNQSPQEFSHLSPANPKFKRLTWIGFTSNANAKTAFFLDNFTLTNKE